MGKDFHVSRTLWARILGCLLLISMLAVTPMLVAANNPPLIWIVEPNHGETVSGEITIWMVAWDDDGLDQIEDVWVTIDDGDLLNATFNHTDHEGSWWFYVWNTTEVDDGWHLITAIVFDGIDEGHDDIEVYVDNIPENSPPLIWIIEPDHGETVSGEITIWMVAWDDDGLDQIEDVWVKIDDGELYNATYSHSDSEGSWWYYIWNTTEVEDGWHLITAIVFDGIDDGHDNIEVFVDNDDLDLGPASTRRLPGFDSWLIILLLVLAGIIAAIFAGANTEVGKFALLKFILLPLYTKVGKKDILDHFVRGEIYGYIKIHPGDNYTTIKNNLELKNGTLTYHLNVLEREGLIKSWSNGGHKYFYPKDVKIPGNGVKNPSIYDAIMKNIVESPGISVKDIAAVTGISRQLANYHVRKLATEGKIEIGRKSFSKVCYPKNGSKNV